jgi:hypothetical protein
MIVQESPKSLFNHPFDAQRADGLDGMNAFTSKANAIRESPAGHILEVVLHCLP